MLFYNCSKELINFFSSQKNTFIYLFSFKYLLDDDNNFCLSLLPLSLRLTTKLTVAAMKGVVAFSL